MTNYDTEIDNSLKYNVLPNTDIYDFRETPFEEIGKQYYEFCRENLNIQSEKVNICPNVFVFNNSYSSNALAKLNNNNFSIIINLGLLIKCKNNYLENASLDLYIEKKIGAVIGKFDNKISGLAFQIATNFTYYHELGHLFQFTKKSEYLELNEHVNETSTYSLLKHCLEINADSFASIAIASHITQYLEKTFQENLNKEICEDVIVILGGCLLNHIANFYSDITRIYLREFSHPHPFLRIFNSILSLVNYINQSTFLKEKAIEIHMYETFKRIIDFYIELEDEKIFKTNFKVAFEKGAEIKHEMIEYLGQLINFNLDDYNNALELWNKKIL